MATERLPPNGETMTDVPGFLLQTAPHGPHGPHAPHGPVGPNGPMGPGGGAGWGSIPWGTAGGGLLPGLLWLLVLLAVLAGLAYLVLRLADGRPADMSDPAESDPVGVLETRYARGEIDDEEFERRRDRLVGGT